MNIKILLASFSLVFLAELGDKTQLTALAFSTSTRSPWSVFFGTSLALVCATALAVVCGEALSRVVPQRVLQMVSAVMFVLVGLVLLVNLARHGSTKEEPAAEQEPGSVIMPPGPVSLFVGRQAVAFEEDLAATIHDAAAKVTNNTIRTALLKLETSHRHHARSLAGLGSAMDERLVHEVDTDLSKGDPERLLASLRLAGNSLPQDDAVGLIIQRQEAAAEFYIALARQIRFHEARDLLRDLAMEEIQLAQELCALVNHEIDQAPSMAT